MPLGSLATLPINETMVSNFENASTDYKLFTLDLSYLSDGVQNESDEFTKVATIMKTKHDTVKNAISNVR